MEIVGDWVEVEIGVVGHVLGCVFVCEKLRD